MGGKGIEMLLEIDHQGSEDVGVGENARLGSARRRF
jgi:hypothetical protein